MQQKFTWIGLLLTLLGLCSCGETTTVLESYPAPCPPLFCYVGVIYSTAGLGDMGFQDDLYKGIVTTKEHAGFTLENIHPNNLKDAEAAANRFFKESDSVPHKKRLLIFASGEYDSLIKANPSWKQDSKNTILVMDSYDKTMDVYSRDISLYGASYLSGLVVNDMGMDSVIIFAANPKLEAINRAVTGFMDGFNLNRKSDAVKPDTVILGEIAGEGFDVGNDSYWFSILMRNSIDFVFPIIGGGNADVFRALREIEPDGFLSCGMDTDQQHLSDNIAFSIVKHSGDLVSEFLTQWSLDADIEKHRLETLESNFIEIVPADGYDAWAKSFKKFQDQAIIAEKKYLEAK